MARRRRTALSPHAAVWRTCLRRWVSAGASDAMYVNRCRSQTRSVSREISISAAVKAFSRSMQSLHTHRRSARIDSGTSSAKRVMSAFLSAYELRSISSVCTHGVAVYASPHRASPVRRLCTVMHGNP
jgi:hypothetical protein